MLLWKIIYSLRKVSLGQKNLRKVLLKKVSSQVVSRVIRCLRLNQAQILEGLISKKAKYKLKVNLIFKTLWIILKRRERIKRENKLKIHLAVILPNKKYLMRKKLASKFVCFKRMMISWVKRQHSLKTMSLMTFRLLRTNLLLKAVVALCN